MEPEITNVTYIGTQISSIIFIFGFAVAAALLALCLAVNGKRFKALGVVFVAAGFAASGFWLLPYANETQPLAVYQPVQIKQVTGENSTRAAVITTELGGRIALDGVSVPLAEAATLTVNDAAALICTAEGYHCRLASAADLDNEETLKSIAKEIAAQ